MTTKTAAMLNLLALAAIGEMYDHKADDPLTEADPLQPTRLEAIFEERRAIMETSAPPKVRGTLAVSCPRCKALPGERCNRSTLGRYAYHMARVRAAQAAITAADQLALAEYHRIENRPDEP
jgi:hypothetical protein